MIFSKIIFIDLSFLFFLNSFALSGVCADSIPQLLVDGEFSSIPSVNEHLRRVNENRIVLENLTQVPVVLHVYYLFQQQYSRIDRSKKSLFIPLFEHEYEILASEPLGAVLDGTTEAITVPQISLKPHADDGESNKIFLRKIVAILPSKPKVVTAGELMTIYGVSVVTPDEYLICLDAKEGKETKLRILSA